MKTSPKFSEASADFSPSDGFQTRRSRATALIRRDHSADEVGLDAKLEKTRLSCPSVLLADEGVPVAWERPNLLPLMPGVLVRTFAHLRAPAHAAVVGLKFRRIDGFSIFLRFIKIAKYRESLNAVNREIECLGIRGFGHWWFTGASLLDICE